MGFQKIRDILRAWKSCQLPKVSENVFPKTVLLKSDICVALSFLVSEKLKKLSFLPFLQVSPFVATDATLCSFCCGV